MRALLLMSILSAICSTLFFGSLLVTPAFAGSGRYFECAWGTLNVHENDNGTFEMYLTAYSGGTLPDGLKGLGAPAPGTNGYVVSVTISKAGAQAQWSSLSPIAPLTSVQATVAAFMSKYDRGDRSDCAPRTGGTGVGQLAGNRRR